MLKQEIINQLLERGVQFNPKQNKAVLEELLEASIAEDTAEEDTAPEFIYKASYKSKQRVYSLGEFNTEEEAKLEAKKRGIVHLILNRVVK